MIVRVDLKLALFILILVVIAGFVVVLLIRKRWQPKSATLHQRLATIQSEFPFGILIIGQSGQLLQSNTVLQQLIPDVSTLQSLAHLLVSLADRHTSGLLSQPVAIRWRYYPLADRTSLFIIIDNAEVQQLAKRQHSFVGHLSHEVRSALTGIQTHLEVSRTPTNNEEVRLSSLNTAYHETARLGRLIRDLVELQRLETSSTLLLSAVNIRLIAEEAIVHVYPQAEQQGIALNLLASDELLLAMAHPDRLKQVFLNLLDNAIKYGKSGNEIVVTLRADTTMVHCSISDTGSGISITELPLVRQALYRGRTDVGGSGLGLALVDEILRQHNSVLDIKSSVTPDQSGTTCSWSLLRVVELHT